MIKSGLIYVFASGAAIFLIWLSIQHGNKLKAPPALPNQWSAVQTSSKECAIEFTQTGIFHLKQSGENISVIGSKPPFFKMDGKVDQAGHFNLSGSVPKDEKNPCSKGEATWSGQVNQQKMEGKLTVVSETCSPCFGNMLLQATSEGPHD